MNNIGIKTLYKNRMFRSRLEARWAAFFDLLRWKYEYEPYDLKGWIPDFSLNGVEELLVEIKPFFSLEEFKNEIIIIENAVKNTAKENTEILLLGATIFNKLSYTDPIRKDAKLGFCLYKINAKESFHYEKFWPGEMMVIQYKKYEEDVYGIADFSREFAQIDKINGLKIEFFMDMIPMFVDYELILSLWNKAGNIVQWSK